MTSDLTTKDLDILTEMVLEGMDVIGSSDIEAVREDNMTWMSARDLAKATSRTLKSVGGSMTSLTDKGLIANSGESARGEKYPDFFVTDKGLEVYERMRDAKAEETTQADQVSWKGVKDGVVTSTCGEWVIERVGVNEAGTDWRGYQVTHKGQVVVEFARTLKEAEAKAQC